MKINVGDKVLKEVFWYKPTVLEVIARTNKSLTTKRIGDISDDPYDKKGQLRSYKAFDAEKVAKIKELTTRIEALHKEYKELYESLPNVE